MKRYKWLALLMSFILATSSVAAMAADQNGRLKESLTDDYIYTAMSLDTLALSWKAGPDNFKARYDETHVLINGIARPSSVASGSKQITLYSDSGNSITVDMAGQNDFSLPLISAGDTVSVYGKISVSLFGTSYKLVAEHAKLNYSRTFTSLTKLYYPDEIIDGVTLNDIAPDKHVTFKVPDSWMDGYVCSRLTNNGIQGYQFSLNALPPYDTEYPEVFYIFYFSDETYLEAPPTDPTDGDNKDIEKVIEENILEELDDTSKIKISDLTTSNNKKLHYSSITYKPKDKNDYRLEFFYYPERRGITVMLYLYYPRESAIHHLREVTYVVDSLQK